MRTKYIFVTGGVMSGLGKGIVTSSIAKLMQMSGKRVSCVKIDPYLNYDAGTMNPIAHGEVFVTEDGGECDMDIGNYERFLNQDIPRSHNITTAQVYSAVIGAEREGKYLGACVQIIPHVTNEIKDRIRDIADSENLEVLIIECGGTVGDIESLPFLEALRQIRIDEEPQNVVFIHVTLAPSLDVVGEQKTKPTQHSVQELRRIGIQPDFLAVRCTKPLEERTKSKIAMFTNVDRRSVLSCHDVESILQVTDVLRDQGAVGLIHERLGMQDTELQGWDEWSGVVRSMLDHGDRRVRIAMVGKYVSLTDSYVSLNLALKHAGAKSGLSVDIDWIDSEEMEGVRSLSGYDGVLVPGGFGIRGSDGIIRAASFARSESVPYLGICFGFQLAAVAFGRDVLGLEDADSTEIRQDTGSPIIDLLPEQRSVSDMGGSLRLGANDISVADGTTARRIYKSGTISKRHRHRYEFNQAYRDAFERAGMAFSADSDSGKRIEILEIPGHLFFVGVQFHPEFSSRPGFPEEMIEAFVRAASQSGISRRSSDARRE